MSARNQKLGRWAPTFGALAAVVLDACSGSPSSTGSMVVGFALPNGWSVNTVSFVVLSSDSEVVLTGTENVSAPNATFSLDVKVPVGQGEVLNITATTGTGISCTGTSEPFDVTAGTSTSISVVLNCGGVTTGSGSSCPVVSVAAPAPAEAVAPTGTIALVATAMDADASDVLSFSWSATAGVFESPTASATRYDCTTAGSESLVLTVDNNHQPSPCEVTLLIPVTCLPGD